MKPIEVVTVAPSLNPGMVVVSWLLAMPLAAYFLMLTVPLAHVALGTPNRHPGFWDCLAVLTLARAIHRLVFVPAMARAVEETDAVVEAPSEDRP